MRRLLALALLAVAALSGCGGEPPVVASSSTVRIGLLHSLTGSSAISESALVNAEKMAIEEINAAGGVTVDGREKKIEPIVEDSASDQEVFAKKIKDLVKWNHLPVVFGGWTAANREYALPLLDEFNGLLVFPAPTDAAPTSRRVLYTGPTADQQVAPALNYLKSQGRTRLYLVGTETRTIKRYAAASGLTIVGEQSRADVATIKAAAPDAVVNTLSGDSNAAFFTALDRAGLTAAKLPVVSLTVTETEARAIGPELLAGHLAVRSYFQTTSGTTNDKFVQAYKAKYGDDKVTSDALEAAYLGVHLWAKAVSKADSIDPEDVSPALAGLTFDAPEGRVTVDARTYHLRRTAHVGVFSTDGLLNDVS